MKQHFMKLRSLFIGLLCLVSLTAQGQDSQTTLFMDLAPQHTRLNISSRPLTSYVGMPVLGNVRVLMGNSIAHPTHWLSQEASASSATVNLDAVRHSLSDRNDLSFNMQWDWLNAGWMSSNRRSFWSISVSEHIQSSLELPEDLLKLPFTGNLSEGLSASDVLDFSSLSLQFSHRREFAATWQYQWNEKLSSGIRLAYLQGLSFAGTRDNTTNWRVDADNYSWTVQGGIGMDIAGLSEFNGEGANEVKDYLNAKGNRGFSADLAFQLKPADKLKIFAQVAELGQIAWTSDVQSWSIQDTIMEFSGLAIDELGSVGSWPSDSIENWLESTSNSWQAAFAVDSTSSDFTQRLSPKWSVGLALEAFNSKHHKGTIGAWARSGGMGFWDWRLSYNHRIKDWVGVAMSWGSSQSRKSTLGLALCLNAGPLSIFVASDHIGFSKWTRIAVSENGDGMLANGDGVLVPNEAHTMQLQGGVSWRLGAKKKSKKQVSNKRNLNVKSDYTRSTTRNPEFVGDRHPGAVPCNAPGNWKD